ncbi:hypothetical protein MANES_11G124000v8 [Manihot esculenta]|uniref:F-box domain-containing protein n=1 Tax=Manihot esculenta TaxID=3983 RepID=A0A2C9V0U2_MANES|nr:hypothetical protein MANES_11G124000v8 [Manihot esculenta]
MKFDYDIFTEILCLLSVETLLRFRCLSKTCCSLIDSPEFINLHLNRFTKTSTNSTLIIDEIEPDGSIYAIDLDSSQSDRCPGEFHRPFDSYFDTLLSHAYTADDRWDCKFYGDVFGSCNGLLAMYNGERMILWNPSTRKHRTLPRFWGCSHCEYELLRGFGYDAVNDEYKLIVLIQPHMEDNVRVVVYSLKANSLTKIKHLHDYSIIHKCNTRPNIGVLVGGSLHWVVKLKGNINGRVILAFDLVEEKIYELPIPDMNNEYCCLPVEELGGSLAICGSRADWIFEIWVMKEYGKMETWTKIFHLSSSFLDKIPRRYPYYSYMKALCCLRTKAGDDVLLLYNLDGKCFFLYDMQQKSAEKPAIFGSSVQHKIICNRISANSFIRSLVPVS